MAWKQNLTFILCWYPLTPMVS